MPENAWMCICKQDSEYTLGPKYAKDSEYGRVLNMQALPEYGRILNI